MSRVAHDQRAPREDPRRTPLPKLPGVLTEVVRSAELVAGLVSRITLAVVVVVLMELATAGDGFVRPLGAVQAGLISIGIFAVVPVVTALLVRVELRREPARRSGAAPTGLDALMRGVAATEAQVRAVGAPSPRRSRPDE